MYATLPPALAELIANSYDADASEVRVELMEKNGQPTEIRVIDDGTGMSREEINTKLLVIGRNRRQDGGDKPSPKFGRMPIGKKGLGKLALFGLAMRIEITTRKDGKENKLVLDWDALTSSKGVYKPHAAIVDGATKEGDGTSIVLRNLKRKSRFDAEALADSLSRIFVLDDDFAVTVVSPSGETFSVGNERRYKQLDREFTWSLHDQDLLPSDDPFFGKIYGELITTAKPISPSSGLRGITLFSRGKMINSPEFYSASASSHFFQYLTGWIVADFIDLMDEDVISTNRQSIDWEHPEMTRFRETLSKIVARANQKWRRERREKKARQIRSITGIDAEKWIETLPSDVKKSTQTILETLKDEDSFEEYGAVVAALHEIVPEYPELHWRHLHPSLKDRVRTYYVNQQYGEAADQAAKIYCEVIRKKTGRIEDGFALVSHVFSYKENSGGLPLLQITPLATESDKNIQEGQGHLSRGLIKGFRNPISHTPIDTAIPHLFSQMDCLNILSLVSYLLVRLDDAIVNIPGSTNSKADVEWPIK